MIEAGKTYAFQCADDYAGEKWLAIDRDDGNLCLVRNHGGGHTWWQARNVPRRPGLFMFEAVGVPHDRRWLYGKTGVGAATLRDNSDSERATGLWWSVRDKDDGFTRVVCQGETPPYKVLKRTEGNENLQLVETDRQDEEGARWTIVAKPLIKQRVLTLENWVVKGFFITLSGGAILTIVSGAALLLFGFAAGWPTLVAGLAVLALTILSVAETRAPLVAHYRWPFLAATFAVTQSMLWWTHPRDLRVFGLCALHALIVGWAISLLCHRGRPS